MMSYRTFVNVVSGVVLIAVLTVGTVVIIGDNDLQGPKATTTVSKDAVGPTPGTTTTTTVVKRTGAQQATRTTTTEVQGPGGAKPAEKTTTTEEGQRTFLERVLGDGGLVVLQIAAVALAAFLAAAITQRVLLGEYGGFKIGALELTAIATASTTGIDELKQALKKLREDAATDVRKAQEESRREDAAANRDLALAFKRMDLIERRLDEANRGSSGGDGL